LKSKLLILATLVAKKHILALAGVPTHTEQALEDPQDAAGGGGGAAVPKRVVHGAAEEDIHGDTWSSRKLRFEIGDLHALHKVNACNLLCHHHDV
jgi:hypothetical protein